MTDATLSQPTNFRELCNELVNDLIELCKCSEGVAGLHKNGDLAPWHELRENGLYPRWLSSFDRAINLLKSLDSESLPVREAAGNVFYEFHIFDAVTSEFLAGGETATLEEATREGARYLAVYSVDELVRLELRRIEVLPAHALPLPSKEVK